MFKSYFLGEGFMINNIMINQITKCIGVPVFLDDEAVFQIGGYFGVYASFVEVSCDLKG